MSLPTPMTSEEYIASLRGQCRHYIERGAIAALKLTVFGLAEMTTDPEQGKAHLAQAKELAELVAEAAAKLEPNQRPPKP